MRQNILCLAVFLLCAFMTSPLQADADNCMGGLAVFIGDEKLDLIDTVHKESNFLVHVLKTDDKAVRELRKLFQSKHCYRRISVDRFDGSRLPFIDNLVNIIDVDNPGKVSMSEMMRVLAPGGVIYTKQDGEYKKITKPRPGAIDEWTHYLHDADNNAVANDTIAGPPRRLQWVTGPQWSRHHEHLSSMNAMVSAGGKIFYVMDEGSRLSIQLPPKWKVIARDAFNGALLWKQDLSRWYTHTYPLKSGPADLPRRIVASGNRVYFPLGIDQALSAFNAETGKIIRTYKETKAAEEVLLSSGVLFVLANKSNVADEHYQWKDPVCWTVNRMAILERAWQQTPRTIVAVEAASGKVLWKRARKVAPLTLAVNGKHVVFYNGERVQCLDRHTGKPLWTSEPVKTRKLPLTTQFAPTLVLQDKVVLFAGGNNKLTAFDAETGKKRWSNRHYRGGHMSPDDVLVVGGLAWTGGLADRQFNNVWTGYNLETGKAEISFPPDIKSYWFHHRCHKSKATVNFLMPSRTGIEFVDWRKKTWDRNHWVRGACVYGVMPANGLVYAPPHPCACYIETKLNGLNALAPADKKPLRETAGSERLEKGPAYGQAEDLAPGPEDWPVYRGNNQRSGCVKTSIPAHIEKSWQTELGGRLSSLTVSCGLCFVAAIDKHTVYALDANNGKIRWQYTAGGRVDSPPTNVGGLTLFGCADGHVYCLRTTDGKLAWRYLVAPNRQRHVAFDQLESVWPVHGSVLVQNGVAYCLAGRSAFLDGGMRLCRLDVKTGKLLSRTVIDHQVAGSDEDLQARMKGLNMPTALPDILSCDGVNVFMRSQVFDLAGRRREITTPNDPTEQIGDHVHLFSSGGFLDGSWFHRIYWLYGQKVTSGCNFWFRAGKHTPAGRLLVFDEDTVYGFGRLPHYYVWSPALEYRIFAAESKVTQEGIQRVLAGNKKLAKNYSSRWIFNRDETGKLPERELSAVNKKWSVDRPEVIVRAMALAGKKLFVAGPPDFLNEEDAVRKMGDSEVNKQIKAQEEALTGKHGGLLWMLSAKDGSRQEALKLESLPVWDGMAAAGGRLYLSTVNGKVACFKGP